MVLGMESNTNTNPYRPGGIVKASEILNFCEKMDRRRSVALTASERKRLRLLTASAQTVGLSGGERLEFMDLSMRRNA